MTAKFVFVNSGNEPIVLIEKFAGTGTFNKKVVQPGDHVTIPLWGGKQVEIITPPEPTPITQRDVYGIRV